MTQAIMSGAAIGALCVLMSIGFALSLEIADIVNAAHGAFVVGAMYLTLTLVHAGRSLSLAIAAAGVVVGALSWSLYTLLIRSARSERGHRIQLVYTLLFRGMPDRIGYVASKFGVTGITYTMALELAPMGIRVNAVAPGMIRTPLTAGMFADPENARAIAESRPIGRAGRPEEVAAAIAYLSSDDAGFVTGTVFPVDGGGTAGIASF
jgi:NAD(P)-dependent dehydrogenase (short-subunit alcohol dehydrogenase family)